MPSPAVLPARAIVNFAPAVSALAVSASVFAGTNALVCRPGCSGCQLISRTASRYLSVAARVTVASSISSRTPVRTGSVSSRPAATATCPTAEANASAGAVPANSPTRTSRPWRLDSSAPPGRGAAASAVPSTGSEGWKVAVAT